MSKKFASLLRNTYKLFKKNKNRHHYRQHHYPFTNSKILNIRSLTTTTISFAKMSSSDSDHSESDTEIGHFNNENILDHLNQVVKLQNNSLISSWIIESHLIRLCNVYRCSANVERRQFISALSMLSVDYDVLCDTFGKIMKDRKDDVEMAKCEEKLRKLLVPQSQWIFLHIGRIENGVKFLVDLRTEIREMLKEFDDHQSSIKQLKLQQLNTTLMELLSLWFSVGFLKLQRITWQQSTCQMLEKVSEYEAVHPIRNWADLKRRVGPYRRCFVYIHSSMPDEPLVMLHTALSDRIHTSMATITQNARRMSTLSGTEPMDLGGTEDASQIKAAVFYSITSTQDGLHGIELGNYLIKRVVAELISEFPTLDQFSTLSPIPKFRKWLYEKLSLLSEQEVSEIKQGMGLEPSMETGEFHKHLKKLLNTNEWTSDNQVAQRLEKPLMRLCAYYLFVEKRRSNAFDSVAHFHLRNGAIMWRLNWMADKSVRGVGNSCGIMINYRYFISEAEENSRNYIENHKINASEQIRELAATFPNS